MTGAAGVEPAVGGAGGKEPVVDGAGVEPGEEPEEEPEEEADQPKERCWIQGLLDPRFCV